MTDDGSLGHPLRPRSTRLLIGSTRVDAADGQQLEVVDPATGQQLADVASAAPQDALDAVAAAAEALPAWSRTAPRQRAELLRTVFERMRAAREPLAELIVSENGKALPDALGEVDSAAEFFRWYAEEAVRLDGRITRSPAGGNMIVVLPQPVGVSVLVTPWNFPAAMATRKIAPALAAGCTVVLKPASATPLTALAVAEMMLDAGVPPGVVNVVPSRRSSAVVNAMLADSRVRKLSFTGSTEVGRILLQGASKRIVNTSMELGGNAPFLVFADADLDAAVEGAVLAKMRNGGQSCIAANRFYVEEPLAEPFSRRLAEALAALRMGQGMDPDVQVGPLITAAARNGVAELVERTVDRGATVLTGGKPAPGPGWFYPPTVLSSVPADAAILAEEVFGPVAPVVTFATEEQALTLANDSPFGLAAYVYTGDVARGMRMSEALETGMVGLNRGFISDPAATFGGVKESGLGREGAHEGLLAFTEPKYVAVDWS